MFNILIIVALSAILAGQVCAMDTLIIAYSEILSLTSYRP